MDKILKRLIASASTSDLAASVDEIDREMDSVREDVKDAQATLKRLRDQRRVLEGEVKRRGELAESNEPKAEAPKAEAPKKKKRGRPPKKKESMNEKVEEAIQKVPDDADFFELPGPDEPEVEVEAWS